MFKDLPIVLDIQEIDMMMLRLLQLRKQHKDRLLAIQKAEQALQDQLNHQKEKVALLAREIHVAESEVAAIVEEIKKLEGQQNLVKKVEEFNALTHKTSAAQRERTAKEQRLNALNDVLSTDEEQLANTQQALDLSVQNSRGIQEEIRASITQVNQEGRELKANRDKLVVKADPEVFRVYERLLRNKKDRVVVAIENRCCTGCHIMLTAQDENLVRKGERMVFCEHCSRIHYWQESQELATSGTATKQRRRKKT